MPLFFWFEASILSLVRRLGWGLGAGLARVGREIDYLAYRTRTASPREKSAWLFRCVVSCVLIAGEWTLLALAGIRADSPIALMIAWATIALLPNPTPRVPLVVARILAVVFTMTNLAAFYGVAKTTYPHAQVPYGTIAAICGVAIWIALSIWALMALRSPASARGTAGGTQPATPATDTSRWSNTPKTSVRNLPGASAITVITEGRRDRP
jgi:hypothetical protein